MNYVKLYLLAMTLCLMSSVQAKQVSADRLNGWLQLKDIQDKSRAMITKYMHLQAQLKMQASTLLQEGIGAADQLADHDPLAALYIYDSLKQVRKETDQTSLDIDAINKKYQKLCDYVDLQIKELSNIRRKHLQFPY